MGWRPIHDEFLSDEDFQSLSLSARYLVAVVFKLLLGRYGIGILYDDQIRIEANLPGDDWREVFDRELSSGRNWWIRSEVTRRGTIYWMRNGLKFQPLQNPNQVKGLLAHLKKLPRCALKDEFKGYYADMIGVPQQRSGTVTRKAGTNHSPKGSQRVPQTVRERVPQTVTASNVRARSQEKTKRNRERRHTPPESPPHDGATRCNLSPCVCGNCVVSGLLRNWYDAHGGSPPDEPKARNPDAYRTTILHSLLKDRSMTREWVAGTAMVEFVAQQPEATVGVFAEWVEDRREAGKREAYVQRAGRVTA